MYSFLITGATGYIGSLLAEKLLGEKKKVTLIVRNPEKLKRTIRNQVEIIVGDVTDAIAMSRIRNSFDALIHCACPTQSSYMISNPVETAQAIVAGTQNMMELAARCRIQSVIYLSSMEVYGKIECSINDRVTEEMLGEIDLTQVRSCYPMAKRMAENYCILYNYEYGVPVKIARLAQTFGRGVSAYDNRVFAQFARSVRENKDIILHTNGNSVGNYCDIDDVLDAILFLLRYGKDSEIYNVVNEENTMKIREMAELVADKIANGKIDVVYDIPKENKYGYAVETKLRLSAKKINDLGWKATTSLVEMYCKMLS